MKSATRGGVFVPAFALVLSGLVSQAPSNATAPSSEDLARRNVIVVHGSAALRVHVPETVTIDRAMLSGRDGFARIFRTREKPGFVGVALIRMPVRPFDASKLFLVGRFGACGTSGCEPRRAIPVVYPNTQEDVRIESGSYRLVVITDHPNTRILLRLPGLEGRALVKPPKPVLTNVRTPPVRLGSARDSLVFSAGNTLNTGRAGLALTMMSLRLDPAGRYGYGACVYSGAAPPPEAAYGPHCGPGSSSFNVGVTEGARTFQFVMLTNYSEASFLDDGDERRSIGMWATTATGGAIRQAGAGIVTLELTP